MADFLSKQHSSRIIRFQGMNWAGTGTSVSTTFLSETWQIRVVSPLGGYINVIPGTGYTTSVLPTTDANMGAFLPANLPEYFTVSPGMIMAYASTTTSTIPVPLVNITEMG